jgi:hypothetical protein
VKVLLVIGLILLAAWVFGALVFHLVGSLMYAALVIGAVLVVWHFVSRAMAGGRSPEKH